MKMATLPAIRSESKMDVDGMRLTVGAEVSYTNCRNELWRFRLSARSRIAPASTSALAGVRLWARSTANPGYTSDRMALAPLRPLCRSTPVRLAIACTDVPARSKLPAATSASWSASDGSRCATIGSLLVRTRVELVRTRWNSLTAYSAAESTASVTLSRNLE